MNDRGWIKLHRKILDCWIWQIKPFDKSRAWIDLLLLAMHHDKNVVIDDKPFVIKRGSYFISRGKLADRWGWSIKKVDAYLKTLENEKMVTTTRTRKGTVVTIVNYEEYQIEGTTVDTTEDTSEGTTEDIPKDTTVVTSEGTQNKNNKELKNNKNNNMSSLEQIKAVVEYLNKVCGTKYRYTTKSTQRHIQARLNDGYTFDDFKTVIDKKSKEWKGTEHERYLSPDTLFGTKFEKYINQKIVSGKKPSNSFNSFSGQRQYDFEDLEKELFGN